MIPYLIAIFICALGLFIASIVNAVKDYTVYKSNEQRRKDKEKYIFHPYKLTIFPNHVLNKIIHSIEVPCIVIGKSYSIRHGEYDCTFLCESIWITDEDFYPNGIQLHIIVIKDNVAGLTFGDRSSLFVHKNTTVLPIELSDNDRRLLKIIKD